MDQWDKKSSGEKGLVAGSSRFRLSFERRHVTELLGMDDEPDGPDV
jgi:hypothetical protein